MNRRGVLLVAVVAIVCAGVLGLPALFGLSPHRRDRGSSPVIDFETREQFVGDIPRNGGPVDITFRFRNTSSRSVQIAKVTTSCGCTTGQYTSEPVVSQSTGSVVLRYMPDETKGTIRVRAVVAFAQKDVPPVELAAQFHVYDPLFVNPMSVELGDFERRAGARGSSTLINKTRQNLKIHAGASVKGYVRGSMSNAEVGSLKSASIDIVTTEQVPGGRWEDAFVLTAEGNAIPPQRIAVSGRTNDASIVSVTKLVDFGFVATGTTKSRRIFLASLDGTPFRVSKVGSDGLHLNWLSDGDAKPKQTVVVTFAPGSMSPGRVSGAIEVEVARHGQTVRCSVPLTAYVVE